MPATLRRIINGLGPETTKISMMQPEIYCHSAHNYSGDAPITTTGAQWNIVTNGDTKLYTVPLNGTGQEWWNVVQIDGSTGQVTPVNTITAVPPE